MAVADAVADHAFAERGRELRREIADLVGVRQQHQIGLGAVDYLAKGEGETVGGVALEQVVLGEQDFVEFVGGEIFGERAHSFADDGGGEAALRFARRFAARRRGFRS